MTSTDDLRRVVSEAEGILKTVNRSGTLPDCMMPDGAEPCRTFQEQDEAIRAVLALFHAALASPTPDGVIKERGSDGRDPDGSGLSLRTLHAANIARQAEWCPDQVPDLSFRGNELAGEVGEACNVVKKLERERHGWRGSRATLDDLAQELADVVICASLCAVTAGIDLDAAVVAKFNATSEKQGLRTMLPEAPASTVQPPSSQESGVGEAEGWVLVPREPTEAMWGGLARQIVMWTRCSRPTGHALHRDLKNCGWEVPAWLADEISDENRVPPKGSVAVAIYRAMIEAAPRPSQREG